MRDLRTEEREKRENRAVPNVLIVLTQSESKTYQQELLTVRINPRHSEPRALTSQYTHIYSGMCASIYTQLWIMIFIRFYDTKKFSMLLVTK